ncbi:MAG TPA: response regulator transcription factor, partial [Acidimicrobiia bacterium]
VLRRAASPLRELDRAGAVEYDGLQIDLGAREARVRGEPATLTAREFELLAFLARRPRQVFRRDELLEHVWGYTYGDTSTVTVHIRRLREKIEDDPSTPRRLTTVWGVGYRFDP